MVALFVLVCVPIYIALLATIVRGQWRVFRKEFPDRKINFSIVDFWTAIVGLTPSFFVVAYGGEQQSSEDAAMWYAAAGALALNQLTGMACGKVEFHRVLGDVVLPQWKSSVGIIVGALVAVMISVVAIPTTVNLDRSCDAGLLFIIPINGRKNRRDAAWRFQQNDSPSKQFPWKP